MPFNLQNTLAAIGQQNQGYQAAQDAQRQRAAQAVAAQRLQQLLAGQSTQSMPGTSPAGAIPQPGGMPPSNGIPPGLSAPGSPVNLFGGAGMPSGAAPAPSFNTEANPTGGYMPATPAPTAPQGDPLGYENVMRSVLSGGGDPATNFMAWQDVEKTLRPYGQIQGRSQLETQRQYGREQLETEKQGGRLQLLQQKNAVIMRGQDKNYQARTAAVASRATPAQQAEFKAAQVEFAQASSNYRNAKMSMNSTPEDIDKLADVALAAQQKMEAVTKSIAGSAPAPAAAGAAPAAAPAGKVKINKGEEVRYDDSGQAFVNRNGQAVPAEP